VVPFQPWRKRREGGYLPGGNGRRVSGESGGELSDDARSSEFRGDKSKHFGKFRKRGFITKKGKPKRRHDALPGAKKGRLPSPREMQGNSMLQISSASLLERKKKRKEPCPQSGEGLLLGPFVKKPSLGPEKKVRACFRTGGGVCYCCQGHYHFGVVREPRTTSLPHRIFTWFGSRTRVDGKGSEQRR